MVTMRRKLMIKIDIDMPKGCWSCPYWFHDKGQSEWKCRAKSQKGRLFYRTYNLDDERQPWCPLIEVKE